MYPGMSQDEQGGQCGSSRADGRCTYPIFIYSPKQLPWDEDTIKERRIPLLDPCQCGENKAKNWGEDADSWLYEDWLRERVCKVYSVGLSG